MRRAACGVGGGGDLSKETRRRSAPQAAPGHGPPLHCATTPRPHKPASSLPETGRRSRGENTGTGALSWLSCPERNGRGNSSGSFRMARRRTKRRTELLSRSTGQLRQVRTPRPQVRRGPCRGGSRSLGDHTGRGGEGTGTPRARLHPYPEQPRPLGPTEGPAGAPEPASQRGSARLLNPEPEEDPELLFKGQHCQTSAL